MSIIPLNDMSKEEIEKGKQVVFLKAQALLSDEGYVLDDTLTARPKDADSPNFIDRYARNGFVYRTITNFEGWLVQFRYQRYRKRQRKKIRGATLPVEFVDVEPRKLNFEIEIAEQVKKLYEKRMTVREIVEYFRETKGIKLKASTVKVWVKSVDRSNAVEDIIQQNEEV